MSARPLAVDPEPLAPGYCDTTPAMHAMLARMVLATPIPPGVTVGGARLASRFERTPRDPRRKGGWRCVVCGAPVRYAGRGRPRLTCERHDLPRLAKARARAAAWRVEWQREHDPRTPHERREAQRAASVRNGLAVGARLHTCPGCGRVTKSNAGTASHRAHCPALRAQQGQRQAAA